MLCKRIAERRRWLTQVKRGVGRISSGEEMGQLLEVGQREHFEMLIRRHYSAKGRMEAGVGVRYEPTAGSERPSRICL